MNEPNKNEVKKPETVKKEVKKAREKRKIDWKKLKMKWKTMNKEKRFYLCTAMGCALALIAIVVIAIAVTNTGDVNQGANSGAPIHSSTTGASSSQPDNSGAPVVNTPEGMVLPVEAVSLVNDYGFYHNQTLNAYYEHVGLDFAAAAGTEVLVVEDGEIESIYKDDLLLGTEIVVNHGNGLKTVYRFVTETDGLKVGDKVTKGETIATIAEATGEEYKDGAHLHFEVLKDGANVDPAVYLPLEEK